MINDQFIRSHINVFGAGLAGCEAAYAAAERGISVRLYEMKPIQYSPAHHSDQFAELVCSNSLRSDELCNAVGLLKEEMRCLGSLMMQSAKRSRVSAGSALAVDRNLFSKWITDTIKNHPNIQVITEEVRSLPENEISIVATGPLTSDGFSRYLMEKLGCGYLHFFDAAAPIIDADSIDREKVYAASRYGKGDAAYLNCPFTKDEYEDFWVNLTNAREADLKDFDKHSQSLNVFEGCMPVEVMALRGIDTLLFGPLKPVGLPLPESGKLPYAVVQLRPENAEKTMYNLVGFQTHLAFEEQRRVFRMIPGLEQAEFLRYGVMHRNTFINSPQLLKPSYAVRSMPNVFFAGQITGVEGYVESAASGIVAGLNAASLLQNNAEIIFPTECVIGAMANYVSNGSGTGTEFQPMNANFGLVPLLGYRVKGGKKVKNEELAKRSLKELALFCERIGIEMQERISN